MSYSSTFYDLLRKDRDDSARAKVFDEWRELQSPQVQEACEEYLHILKNGGRLGEQQSKSVLCTLVLFVNMKVDEQDRWRARGERIRTEFEWMCAKHGVKFEELV